jgi:uncharacterized protein YjbJ (UPF0337 family)
MQSARRPHNHVKQPKNMKQSTQDKVAGTAKIVSGTVKQETGKMIRKPRLEAAGNAERTEGHLQKKVGKIEKVLDV